MSSRNAGHIVAITSLAGHMGLPQVSVLLLHFSYFLFSCCGAFFYSLVFIPQQRLAWQGLWTRCALTLEAVWSRSQTSSRDSSKHQYSKTQLIQHPCSWTLRLEKQSHMDSETECYYPVACCTADLESDRGSENHLWISCTNILDICWRKLTTFLADWLSPTSNRRAASINFKLILSLQFVPRTQPDYRSCCYIKIGCRDKLMVLSPTVWAFFLFRLVAALMAAACEHQKPDLFHYARWRHRGSKSPRANNRSILQGPFAALVSYFAIEKTNTNNIVADCLYNVSFRERIKQEGRVGNDKNSSSYFLGFWLRSNSETLFRCRLWSFCKHMLLMVQ